MGGRNRTLEVTGDRSVIPVAKLQALCIRRRRIKKRRKTLSVMTLHGSRQGITADLLYLHAASLLRTKLVESA
jgi:hypothetical protein